MKYPNDIVDDYGRWSRIHRGHNLDHSELQRDLEWNADLQREGEHLHLREVWFRWIPRIMWCADYGGCDQEGEWHSHWVETADKSEKNAYTVVSWELS